MSSDKRWDMTSIISINDTSTTNNITYYHITIKLPLRSLTIVKRYNDFPLLIDNLSYDLGIDAGDFPYKLPSKTSFFNKNSDNVIQQRKVGLARFLNCVINDGELMNHPIVHDFLQLPVKFKFTKSTISNHQWHDLVLTNEKLTPIQWLEYIRLFKSKLLNLMESLTDDKVNKVDTLNKLHQVFTPNLTKLSHKLQVLQPELDDDEYNRRTTLINELKDQITQLENYCKGSSRDLNINNHNNTNNNYQTTTSLINGNRTGNKSRRVIGQVEPPKETSETLPLSNKQLLSQQMQIHQHQDQELGELRKLIERQKQIGLVINQEVEEQNEMLDELNHQVDVTTNKLRGARKKAKRIL